LLNWPSIVGCACLCVRYSSIDSGRFCALSVTSFLKFDFVSLHDKHSLAVLTPTNFPPTSTSSNAI